MKGNAYRYWIPRKEQVLLLEGRTNVAIPFRKLGIAFANYSQYK